MAKAPKTTSKAKATVGGKSTATATKKNIRRVQGRPPKNIVPDYPDTNTMLDLYEQMLLIRRFEEKAGQLYGMGVIGGFCHLYIGQEAIVVGMQSVSKEGDSVITSYRDHGHMLACGMTADGVMAELTGRRDGYSRGKGGSMHMFSREKNFFGGHGIVAAQVPIGLGLAFSHQYRNTGGVSLTYFGDGAINQGQVYESFNMAALWKLPVVFIIENNQYGMGTSVSRAAAGRDLADRGKAYGIPGMQVDGMNVLAVREAGAEAMAYCRDGKGPFILEMQTYRYRGHSMSDPAKYRTREEVDAMRKQRDPIDALREILINDGVENDKIKSLDTKVKAIVSKASDFALESPEPDEAELWTDVILEGGVS
ncbi:MAG: pyruvate dehydrogenase (acetyl-transferring) E1 component subunit alpha [Proteobacteria bacterium]|nr:pyruvate dehydrogenase (acetyl-transferring) E1 component subunit alpha [Pseudomonadota bacterium]